MRLNGQESLTVITPPQPCLPEGCRVQNRVVALTA